MRDENIETWKNVLRTYAYFEAQIDNLMPMSRRANRNAYCKSIGRINDAAFDAAATLRDLQYAIEGGGDRYRKINLSSFYRHGTIEFRQHSGTVDAEKATSWVRLVLALVDAARKGKKPAATAAAARNMARPGSKAAMVGDLIMRPEGATSAEINAAVGRNGVNVITIARACGIAIRKEKRGQVTRYYASGDAATASLEALFEMVEAAPELRGFYQRRREFLAARANNGAA
jgi:hypothetical protein